jgi:hypothetical protein
VKSEVKYKLFFAQTDEELASEIDAWKAQNPGWIAKDQFYGLAMDPDETPWIMKVIHFRKAWVVR